LLRLKNVLFLCTGNSARSIMAEVMLNHLGRGRFRAFSAGSHPTGKVNPIALETLEALGIKPSAVRSKSWEEFAAPGAPPIDLVLTVCDSAAAETCPVWPGRPVGAHWGVEDPAAVEGSDDERRAAFRRAATVLRLRIERLLELDIEGIDPATLRARLQQIGDP